MSMQNIGIGGTLSFNAAPGLQGMQQAAHGFDNLDKSREHFQHNLHQLGESFEHFNLLAAGFGVAGVAGLHSLIHSSFEAGSEQEQAQLKIGTALGIARGKGFKHGLALAGQEVEHLEDIAVATGANAEGLFAIYRQVLMPLSQAGASLEKVRDLTKQTGIMAMATGTSFEEMGSDITRFLGGFVHDRDPLFRQLKMAGMVRSDMAAEELQTMAPTERLKLIQQVLKRYAEGAGTISHSWTALGQSVANIVSKVKEEFIGMKSGLFATVKDDMLKVINYFIQHKEHVLQTAAAIGSYLVPVYDVLKQALVGLATMAARVAISFAHWVERIKEFKQDLDGAESKVHSFGDKVALVVARISTALSKIGVSNIGVRLAQMAMVFGTLIPMLSLFSAVLGPGLALLRAVGGALQLVVTLAATLPKLLMGFMMGPWALPILVGLAGIILLFMAMRKEGESFGQTVMRIWTDYVKPFVDGFKRAFMEGLPSVLAPLQVAFDMIKEAVLFLADYLADTFTQGSASAEGFGSTLGSVASFLLKVITTTIGAFGKLIAGAIYGISWIIYGLKQMGKWVGEGLMMAVNTVVQAMKVLVNVLTAPFRAILDFVSSVVEKIASTEIGRKAMKLVGIDPEEVKRTAREIGDIAARMVLETDLNPDHLGSFSKAGETPDEEVLRKRASRLNQPKEQNIKVESKHDIKLENKLVVDGKVVAQAQASHQVEISERAGAKTSPWQRRAALVRQQALPAGGH